MVASSPPRDGKLGTEIKPRGRTYEVEVELAANFHMFHNFKHRLAFGQVGIKKLKVWSFSSKKCGEVDVDCEKVGSFIDTKIMQSGQTVQLQHLRCNTQAAIQMSILKYQFG